MSESAIDRAAISADWEAVGAGGAVREIARAFLEDADVEIDACIRASEKGDFTEVARLAHRLKSSSGTLHARRLVDLLRDSEQAARRGDGASCRRLSRDLLSEYPRVRAEVLQLIAE